MGWWGRLIGAEQRDALPSLENPQYSLGEGSEELARLFGAHVAKNGLPPVTIESALEVPSVFCATGFLARTMASLPLHAFASTDGAPKRLGGDLDMLLNEAANPELTSFDWRYHMWMQVYTGGRGITWIERAGVKPVALWPMDPARTTVIRRGGRKFYRFEGQAAEYPATDVIDVGFMPKADGLGVYSPIYKGRQSIGLAIAMNTFATQFFASGGTPPLALEGPLPQGAEGFRRAQADIQRAIDFARKIAAPFFGLPPGHKLTPVGIDPAKGQMTEARLFQLGEIARLYSLPLVFLQDLTKGTFNNVEHQDLQLVKHNIGQRAKQFEDELNLKLFGQRRRARYVRHNIDGLMRGAFKDRIEAIARAIQTAQMTPDEGRALEERPPLPGGNSLYIQGATVPLEKAGTLIGHNGGPALDDGAQNDNGEANDDEPDVAA